MVVGKYVSFRSIKIEDASLLCRWYRNKELMKHVGFEDGLNVTEEGLIFSIANEVEDKSIDRTFRRFIIIENESGDVIGELSFNDLDLVNKCCRIGIKICEIEKQHRGYGYEAVRLFLEYLFNSYGLHRIELDTLLENRRAQGLYKKVGFKEIGVKRDCWLDPQGNYRSAVLMDILKDEYQ